MTTKTFKKLGFPNLLSKNSSNSRLTQSTSMQHGRSEAMLAKNAKPSAAFFEAQVSFPFHLRMGSLLASGKSPKPCKVEVLSLPSTGDMALGKAVLGFFLHLSPNGLNNSGQISCENPALVR